MALVLVVGGTVSLGLGAIRPSEPRPVEIVDQSVLESVPDRTVEALLLKARRQIDQRTRRSLEEAEETFRRVAELRRGDPRADAGLARVAAMRADLRLGDRFELYHQARSWAERALETAPNLADAHLALSTTRLILDWDPAAAAQSLDHALASDPQNPDVYQVQSWQLSAGGDHGAAQQAARRAVELDPESASRRADLAFVLMIAGNGKGAIAEAQAALVLDPASASAWGAIIRSHLMAQDLEAAFRAHLDLLRHQAVPEEILVELGSLGRAEGYWTFLDRLLAAAEGELLVPRAAVQANLGQAEVALSLLERAAERRDWEILWLERLPELESLRGEPRFLRLIERRGSLSLASASGEGPEMAVASSGNQPQPAKLSLI